MHIEAKTVVSPFPFSSVTRGHFFMDEPPSGALWVKVNSTGARRLWPGGSFGPIVEWGQRPVYPVTEIIDVSVTLRMV